MALVRLSYTRCWPGDYGHTAGVVGSAQQDRPVGSREELIDRLAGTPPMSVIIKDEHAVRNKPRDEMLKLVPCRLIPIGVQPKYCNLGRCLLWQRLVDGPLNKVEPGLRVSGTPQVAAYILD